MSKHLNLFFIATIFLIISCGIKPLATIKTIKSDKRISSNKISQNREKKVEQLQITQINDVTSSEKILDLGPYFNRGTTEKSMELYCNLIDQSFLRWGWGKSRCERFPWNHVRKSVNGRPLMWLAFGDEKKYHFNYKDVTIIFCGVHGDEITPVKFCFDIIYYLQKNFKSMYHEKLIVVAPIVNPDSFFKKYPTRTNARLIDINRNFPTEDWKKNAHVIWKNKYHSDKRRYPGKKSMSEPEVIFQVNLIKRYKPNKIISVHAPLTMLDYDGPILQKKSQTVGAMANRLLKKMSEDARGYRVKDYPFFPGSLGNWAGNERGIPTYTLELPSSDNRKHIEFWSLFKDAIHTAFTNDLREYSENVPIGTH